MLSSAFSPTRLRAQFIKEILSVLRDPRSRMVVFVPTILQLLVFAFAATLEGRNVDIAVYNQDSGRWSHELVQRLDSAHFITQLRHVDNLRQLHVHKCWSTVDAATPAKSQSPTCLPSLPGWSRSRAGRGDLRADGRASLVQSESDLPLLHRARSDRYPGAVQRAAYHVAVDRT